MSCEQEIGDLGGDASGYLDKKLTFLADLLRRFDPPSPDPAPPSTLTNSEAQAASKARHRHVSPCKFELSVKAAQPILDTGSVTCEVIGPQRARLRGREPPALRIGRRLSIRLSPQSARTRRALAPRDFDAQGLRRGTAALPWHVPR
jgi:hypothetical protein